MMDRFTRHLVAVLTNCITADGCARILFEHWIVQYGCPEVIVTDQGRQFESAVFDQVCQAMGMEKRRTCAYHPQSNGLVERAHQELKKLMRCLLVPVAEATGHDWESVLPHTLMAYNTTINDTGCSPKQLLFATDMVLSAGSTPRVRV